jgi:hypothetical protein
MKYKNAVYTSTARMKFVSRDNEGQLVTNYILVTMSQVAKYWFEHTKGSSSYEELPEPTKLAIQQVVYNMYVDGALDSFFDDETYAEFMYDQFYNELEITEE